MKRKIEPKSLSPDTKICTGEDEDLKKKAKPAKNPFFSKDDKEVIIYILILCFYVIFFALIFSHARKNYFHPIPKEFWELEPPRNSIPIKYITRTRDIEILKSMGLSDCRVKKVNNWMANEKTLICNRTRYLVYCDPDAPYYTACCFQTK